MIRISQINVVLIICFYDTKNGLWYVEIKSGSENDDSLINKTNKEKLPRSL